MNHRPPAERGFTLLELMVTLTVAGILFAIGIPSFRSFVQGSRITAPANEMMTASYLARAEAVKRRSSTVFCFSTNPTAALPDCAGTGTEGWIVWVDVANPAVPSANDRNGKVDAGEPIILRHGPLGTGVTAKTIPANNKGYVSYAASGMARTIAAVGAPTLGVVLCDSRGNTLVSAGGSAARGITFTPVGRPRVTRDVAEITLLGGCP